MKVFVLAGDESILVPGSRARDRMIDYAELFDELHIVVAARRAHREEAHDTLRTYDASGRSALARYLRVWRRATAVCRAVHPDIISSENADVFGLIGYGLARRFGVPLQAQVHTDVLSPHYRTASWRERFRYLLARFVLPRASCIRAVSPRVGAAITRELGVPAEKIRVLPIWTDVDGVRSAPRHSPTDDRLGSFELRLVSAGRFVEREKNFRLLIDAMVQVTRAVPQSVLVIAGAGPDRRLLEQRIRLNRLETKVWIESWRADLPSFIKSFDLFLLASNFEGWPRVCIEAIAAGIPIVMTDVGPAGDLLIDGRTCRIVPVGNVQALSEAILALHADRDRRQSLAQAAQNALDRLPNLSKEEYLASFAGAMRACLDG